MGEPVAFSQAIHLAPCTLYQCNLFTSVPIWAECQLQVGALLETPLLTSCAGAGQIFLSSPSFHPTGVGAIPEWFLSYPPVSASDLLHALQEWAGRSLWAQLSPADGLVCSCCSKETVCISQALDDRNPEATGVAIYWRWKYRDLSYDSDNFLYVSFWCFHWRHPFLIGVPIRDSTNPNIDCVS